jgi:hypothetical protein
MLLSTGPGIGLYDAYDAMDAMDGTACGRPPEYCNGGAMAGIDVAARGTDAEEVTAELVVAGGCVTDEAYEENVGCWDADVCG